MTNQAISQRHLLNAHGPYSHGVWRSASAKVGNDEALAGRPAAIVDAFVENVLRLYSIDEVRAMTFVDIGCYDGYLSVEIEKRLPFKKMVGVEPRKQNIRKGEFVRNYLGIETNIKFIEADLYAFSRKNHTYDIVFCSGLIHHLEDVSGAINALAKLTKKVIFIESQCYAPLISSPALQRLWQKFNKRSIEPKDIVYKFIEPLVGVSGFKLETNYYDGSANKVGLVSIPSPETIIMSLICAGFEKPITALNPLQYRQKITSKLRDFRSTCIFAQKTDDIHLADRCDQFIFEYELAMLNEQLPNDLITLLLNPRGPITKKIMNWLMTRLGSRQAQSILTLFKLQTANKFQKEILGNLKYDPPSKLGFEKAKLMIGQKKYGESLQLLESLASKENVDWRVFYRSCALLSVLNEFLGQTETANYWKNLVSISNPNYPLRIILEIELHSLLK